jgi:hypothetical protein
MIPSPTADPREEAGEMTDGKQPRGRFRAWYEGTFPSRPRGESEQLYAGVDEEYEEGTLDEPSACDEVACLAKSADGAVRKFSPALVVLWVGRLLCLRHRNASLVLDAGAGLALFASGIIPKAKHVLA